MLARIGVAPPHQERCYDWDRVFTQLQRAHERCAFVSDPQCIQRLDLATSEVAAGGTVVSSLPPPAPLLYAEPPVQATAPAPVPARQLLCRPMPFTQLPPQPVMPVLQRRCKSRRKWRADPARQEFYCLWKPALIVQHSLRAAR